MPKVKIIFLHGNYDSDGDFSWSLKGDETEWEEIAEEDVKLLRKHLYELPGTENQTRPIMVEQDSVPVQKRVSDLRDILKVKLQKEAEQKARAAERAALRRASAETKAKNKELRILKELQKKYGVK